MLGIPAIDVLCVVVQFVPLANVVHMPVYLVKPPGLKIPESRLALVMFTRFHRETADICLRPAK